MPICAKCDHKGEDHNWISPPCSRCSGRGLHCPFCFEKYQRRRKRGQCHCPNCRCAAYKPDATTGKPFAQLTLYALALSHLTGIPLFDFKCAWFNEREYCEFFPRTVLARKNTR